MAAETSELKDTQRRYLQTIALSLRPNTVLDVRKATNAFIGYLEAEHPELRCFSQLERSHIEGWLRHLASRPLRASTRRKQIINVRCFLERIQLWGWKEGPRYPLFRRGDLPAGNRCLPRPLSAPTDRALKEEFKRQGGLIPTALLLLRATGLRCQEFLDLELDALRKLSEKEWALRVPLGKLHSERVIPLDSQGARLFQEILELRGSPGPLKHPETGKPTHFLLVRPDGRRLTRKALRYHLERAEKRVPLSEHPTPHRLRHSYATEMVRAGMNLVILMKILGHRSIAMTLRYVEVSGVDVQCAYAETVAFLQERYQLQFPPPQLPRAVGSFGARESLLAQVETLAAQMEGFRRDHASKSQRKPLQRLVERLRRLRRDFENLCRR